ncbi:D-2-hydroxyacid dehydrogenase [Aetokthonos hydrillicola Thurmond2011]|jgi:phosphoglycerate dehydrogenase-like enzyme|uniref:D-2-hydroxyacid dehydrogenase n=1 Tax=Aetokthonos hydrillicola Thurmond2011 TaxID=2712845 RepID=A0AAP5MBI0_9CYAN|nr:D-2-hydroxyacid dehydrogenase [Aetokthonos hydrillicola]MBO3462569.1 D-2-hydroxyacid dehydrogenase [Aetokthonos hydrillicola CCALA 1050]MBW4590357.1 D-2-hydroxyacid dehydrogenase [Aetokthonos hydrillicola CCALA 1050]MDR9896899.1 D-2-hydroxyacid dehydrogenase [Aetokthonos hydrillicola Thurmond2011]
MKLILPVELAAKIEPLLPRDTTFVRVDNEGNFDGDPSGAEVYLNGFKLKNTTLHKVLAAAPKIRWQHTPSAGVNHILTPVFLEHDILLTNGSGVHGIPIAEFVLTYMLYHAKDVSKLQDLQSNHQWIKWSELQELYNKNLLIIGTGSIGREIAVRAKAFGMNVFGSRLRPDPLPNFDLIVSADEWRSLLPQVDYVVVATPLTPKTRGLIDADALRLMRKSAYLINIARGAIVDEDALLTALREGWIAGAGLDTFSVEPLPSDSPFWSLPNVFVTPHSSALTPQLRDRIVELFLDNLTRYRNGKPLRNIVDKKAGY